MVPRCLSSVDVVSPWETCWLQLTHLRAQQMHIRYFRFGLARAPAWTSVPYTCTRVQLFRWWLAGKTRSNRAIFKELYQVLLVVIQANTQVYVIDNGAYTRPFAPMWMKSTSQVRILQTCIHCSSRRFYQLVGPCQLFVLSPSRKD